MAAPAAGPPLKKNGAFALFWAARTISWAGSGISAVVLPVLVYQRTDSPALTSLLAAVEVLPYIAFGLLAGALADRVRRRRLMVGCDLGCAALMAAIPAAGAFGRLMIPLVVLVALGAASLFVWFDAASFGAVPALAGPGRVLQAVSGLSAAGSVTSLVAPAVAGGLLAVLAPAQAIIVDAASYLVSAALLASIRRPFETRAAGLPGGAGDRPDGGAILGGLRFLWGHRLLRAMTMASTAASVTGGAGTGLLVVYAVSALGLARTDGRIGLLYSAAAAGGLIAAVALPRIRRRVPAGQMTLLFLGLNVVAVAGVALAPGFGFALIALAGYLFCYSMVTVNGIAYRQEVAPDGLQSRVSTAGRMLGWGGYPLGALAGGAMAEVLPIRVTLLVMAAPVAAAFVLGFRPLSESRAANVTDRLAGMAELPGHLRPFVLQTDACPRERLGTIDLYLPTAGGGPRPAVLFVHGGPIPADLRPTPRDWPAYIGYGQATAARGAIGVTVDHRLHSAGDFGTAAADLAAAVEQARADPRLDPGRLALWFFSGGGLLLADWLRDPPGWLRCVAATYPMLAATPEAGVDPRFRPAVALAGSKDLPVVLTRVGLERPWIAATVTEFVAAASKHGTRLELIDVPNGHHGFDTLDHTDESRRAVEQALDTVLRHLNQP